MATFVESYLLNSSEIQSVTANNQTIVPRIALTSFQGVRLTIRGAVFRADSQDAIPIGGAIVTVYESDGRPIAESITAQSGPEEGSYTIVFDGSLNTTYTITATAQGFDPVTRTVIFENTVNTVVILLLNNDTSTPIIYGTVVDSTTGKGIPGVNINISGGDSVVNVRTIANGVFLAYDTFRTGVSYTVIASLLGYIQTTQTVQIPEGSVGRNLLITLSKDTTNLTNIVGQVVVEGSDPPVGIPNALVALYVVGSQIGVNEQVVQTVLTDEFGSYTFTEIDPSLDYIIRATKVVPVTLPTR